MHLFLSLMGLHYCVGFALVAGSRGYSLLPCTGFSLLWLLCCRAQALGVWASTGPVVAARVPESVWASVNTAQVLGLRLGLGLGTTTGESMHCNERFLVL